MPIFTNGFVPMWGMVIDAVKIMGQAARTDADG